MKKRIALVLVLLLVGGMLTACVRSPQPDEVFFAFKERYALPGGKVYRTTASTFSDELLTHELFRQLYARPDGSDDFEDVESCVVWQGTSLDYVYEMGVFLCTDGDAARSVLLMCKNRLRLIRSLRNYTDTTAADTAVLLLRGRMVIFMVLPDNALAEKVIDRVL